jgi:hypothetical protein
MSSEELERGNDEEEEESGGDDSSEYEDEEDEEEEEEEEDPPEALLKSKRTVLWLCQEGQIHLARKRLELLLSERGEPISPFADQLRKEIFQVGRDKNYALHEILMGGTSDRNAYAITLSVLEISKNNPSDRLKMLSCAPPSDGRTPLHWAAWGNAKWEILDALVKGNPEALLVRDKKNRGERTPLEILKRYFSRSLPGAELNIFSLFAGGAASEPDNSRIPSLERMTTSWVSHRVRLVVYLCANRYFGATQDQQPLVPFDKADRRVANIKPKPWFLLSIIGYLVQREMKPLALRIVSYLGSNAKIVPKKRRKQLQTDQKKRQRGTT